MSNTDVECPYCGAGIEICHDDGYGLDEGGIFHNECRNCEKIFTYTIYISISHEARKADCLNGSPHNYKKSVGYPSSINRFECVDCGDVKYQ